MTDFTEADSIEDARLLAVARAGDTDAFGQLWDRHAAAARRYAAHLSTPSDADDLVSEGFFRVFRAIANGGGPESAFRTYLYTTLRRAHIDHLQAYRHRVRLTGENDDLDLEPTPSADEIAGHQAEQLATWRALALLPAEQRSLLWQLIVEESTPAELAPAFHTTPNGVSSRAVRARERLRQAYLQASVHIAEASGCRPTRSRLGQYVRDGVSSRDRHAIEIHLESCGFCRAALAEARAINRTMRGTAAPVLAGAVLLLLRRHLGGVIRPGRLLANSMSIKGATVAGAAVSAVLVVSLPAEHGHLGGGRPADRDALAPIVRSSATPSRTAGLPPRRRVTDSQPDPIRPTSGTPSAAPSGTFVISSRTARPTGSATSTARSDRASSPATSATPHASSGSRTDPDSPAGSDPNPNVTGSSPAPPGPSPSAPSQSSDAPHVQTTEVRQVEYSLAVSDPTAFPGVLDLMTTGWQIQSVIPEQPERCSLESSMTARCQLAGSSPNVLSFEVTVVGPGSPGLLQITFQGRTGPPISQSVPLS